MSKKYMHLDDTNFPNVNGVNPYKYHNNFDYSRWRGLVGIKLVNVKWNSNYTDVPKWDSNSQRDEYFDNKEGLITPLETLFNITPENTVKVPIPYNDAYNYNYLVVDMPIQTSANEPIAYEDENIRIKRWYYFIDDMVQFSPNTTELKISLDYWSMFINTVSIPYLLLERGHAPMVQTNVETFLSNPIENSEFLLADDFNYGNSTIIKHTNYYPIGNGSKYVLFAVPFNKTDFQNLVPGTNLGNSTPATFSNTAHVRWGYQYQVNGYEWNYGHRDYNASNLPIRNATSNDGNLFNGVNVFAIKADEASSFFAMIAEKYAYVMNAIQACFILANDMFARNDSFVFEGYDVYKCVKNTDVENIVLTKNDFEFDNKYKEITKLYTFPYSVLEITDDNGNTFEIKVENTSGNMQMRNEINIAYPYMNYNILFTGINGNGSQQYIWSEIAANKNKTIWEDDFSKYMMTWDIPTFSLFVSNETDFGVTNYPRMQAERSGAIVDYQNAVRYADVGYENTEDSLATQRNNSIYSAATAQDNTENAADTDKANADRQSNTNRTTNDRTSNTNKTNNDAKTNTEKINADAVSNMVKNNNNASAETDFRNTERELDINRRNVTRGFDRDLSLLYWNNNLITNESSFNQTKLSADYIQDLRYMNRTYAADVDAEIASTVSNTAGAIASNAVSGAGGIATLGGATAGAISGGNILVGAVAATASSVIVLAKKYEVYLATYDQIREKTINADNYIENMRDLRRNYNIGTCNAAIEYNTIIADNLKNMGDLNNDRRKNTNIDNNGRRNNTELGNNARTNDTDLGNNNRTNNAQLSNNADINAMQLTNNDATQTMLYENANRTYNTDTGNANRTYNTEEPNAKWNRDSAIEAAKANLNQKQVEMEAAYKSANLNRPVSKGAMNGDANPDLWERRGIRVNVRTQSKSAIAQTGDAMLRFGYAINRVWDMENGFDYMKYFTYWKASDVWINDGSGTAGEAVGIIQAILLAGVTIWNDADLIGNVSIYDNLEYQNG